MSSSARELLKWVALVCMTFDHVAKVFYHGYVPLLSELGRIAFPLFALVMAYNLAQPGADVGKSVRRLVWWGVLAQPVHAWAFGYWLPVNVLLAFALAAAAVWAIQRRRWVLLTLCAAPAPLFVDYQWAGIALVVTGWAYYAKVIRNPVPVVFALISLCWFNGSLWALLAVPVIALSEIAISTRVFFPRMRWVFYGYYVGHLLVLCAVSRILLS
ncbi:TraX family protein [Xanthomonas vasicola]|uniref:TraX family protein n=1 Tax=Xanthomonas vasicola TaxID=56459 RepID=UPI00034BE52B|nr:TraX family protein [Xanthomonas vasicola]KFA34530.1 conjugal transfer protein [Xanthomonas vasicola pv. vasculorum NCPPB 206]MDO6950513.1 TraX family protein [Xanthomonas vasicola]